MTSLEPILCEISDKRKSLRLVARRRGSANGSRARRFLPQTPSTPCSLALRDDFRQLDWAEVYKYPTVMLQQMRELVGTAQSQD